MILTAGLIYGGFALAAEARSWLPLFLIYAMIGLAAAVLPLRLFPRASRMTALIWAAACTVAFTYDRVASQAHALIVTILLIAGACALGLHVAVLAVDGALDEDGKPDEARPRRVLAFVVTLFTLSGTGGLIATCLLALPGSLLAARADLLRASEILGAASLGCGLLVALLAGIAHWAVHVSRAAPEIPRWGGQAPVRWRVSRSVIPRRRARTIVDRIGDVAWRALLRLAESLRIVACAAARGTVNILFTAARLLANAFIFCLNFVIRVIVVAARCLIAGVARALWVCLTAVGLILTFLLYAVIVAALPIGALVGAAVAMLAAAQETERYLLTGSLTALLLFAVLAVAGLALVTASWIGSATHPLRKCLASAQRSAIITAPYLLIFVAVGGWMVGLPGMLGHGRIHVGLVTIASSVLLLGSLVWSHFSRGAQEDEDAEPASAVSARTSARAD